jgi:hypothetical protein
LPRSAQLKDKRVRRLQFFFQFFSSTSANDEDNYTLFSISQFSETRLTVAGGDACFHGNVLAVQALTAKRDDTLGQGVIRLSGNGFRPGRAIGHAGAPTGLVTFDPARNDRRRDAVSAGGSRALDNRPSITAEAISSRRSGVSRAFL